MKPSKYDNLQLAQKAGINVPVTLFLSESDLGKGGWNKLLNKFIDQSGVGEFIVRSAMAAEDGNNQSFAGHFFSSEKTKASELPRMVELSYEENKKRAKKYKIKGSVNLMVQPFMASEFGGVLFSRWKYFRYHCVGEVSRGGAQKAVEGIDSEFFLLSKNDEYKDLIVPENIDLKNLKAVLLKLESVFDFPMDIEWCQERGVVTVLQIRPITRSLQSLKIADSKGIQWIKKNLLGTGFSDWRIESYAESFGVLSPASFELIKQNFENTLETFKDLGFRAESFDFLYRAPNGQIYSSPSAQKKFFKLESWKTSFWQVLNEKKFFKQVQSFNEKELLSNKFDHNVLNKLFSLWQIANFYAAFGKNKSTISTQSWAGEYELDNILNLDLPNRKSVMDWSDWRDFYKQAWLYELDKLKRSKKAGLGVFSDKNSYERDIKFSLVDYPANIFETDSEKFKKQFVVKGDLDLSKVFVVKNPKTFTSKFPDGCVLVAPYFLNDWIGEIDHFSGIILEQGGMLSHSAIVAREKSIPYAINWDGAVLEFSN